MDIKTLAEAIHQDAVNRKQWVMKPSVSELLCGAHAHISGALEAHKANDKELFAEKLADIVICVFDMAEGYSGGLKNINIEQEIWCKHIANINRPY